MTELGTWRRSTRCGPNQNCVELTSVDAAHLVRDSKHPAGGALRVPTRAWVALRAALDARP